MKYANLTIRQLKAIVKRLHDKEGCILNKPMIKKILGVDKTYSRLTKSELITMLAAYDSIKAIAPKGEWVTKQWNNRVVTCSVGDVRWTTNIGVDSEQEAYRGLEKLADHCFWIAYRGKNQGTRTGYNYELKVWMLDAEQFRGILRKSAPAYIATKYQPRMSYVKISPNTYQTWLWRLDGSHELYLSLPESELANVLDQCAAKGWKCDDATKVANFFNRCTGKRYSNSR